MKIVQILGTGCPKCNQLAAATDVAATALGLEFQMEKVTDLKRIMSFGVMTTPSLVVDGVVKCVGRVPKTSERTKRRGRNTKSNSSPPRFSMGLTARNCSGMRGFSARRTFWQSGRNWVSI